VDGLIDLNDKDLINEVKQYTRNDLIDRDEDIRLTTKHFDFVMALAIAWQMKDSAEASKKPEKKVTAEEFFAKKMKKQATKKKPFKMTSY
jgi:hypothetical protein